MKQNQKGSSNIFLILAVIVVLAVGGLYLLKSRTSTAPTETVSSTNQAIQSPSGLDTASAELDATDIDDLDTGMNQISTDASSL